MQKVIKVTESNAIKKKMMAATSMLLVAVIMLVSASYAWFTLSTAPEVTGITTAVGANGNLEMALANENTWGALDPGSNYGDSMSAPDQTVQEANETWGNLVDLSTGYGFDLITLLPATLNINENGTVNTDNLLKVPVYGYDGRIESLAADKAITGVYENNTFASDDAAKGVRAIGTSASMTARQLAYRNALSTIRSQRTYVRDNAIKALADNGAGFTTIILNYAENSTSATFDKDDVATVSAMADSLATASTHLEKALMAAVVGYAASSASGLSDAEFEALNAAVASNSYSITNSATDGTYVAKLTIAESDQELGDLQDYFNYYVKIKADIADAQSKISALSGDGPFTWAQLSAPLSVLINTDEVTVNGMDMDAITAEDDPDTEEDESGETALMNKIVDANLAVNVVMPTGSGVFADFADFAKDYQTMVDMGNETFKGIQLSLVDTTIKADSDYDAANDTTYLSAAIVAVNGAGQPAGTTAGTSVSITDYYGYAVDLLFRTNASNSNLMLQIDEAQRVYSDSENTETQGSGSNMTFSSTELTVDSVKKLMGAIRVVFVDDAGNILSKAMLDTTNAEVVDAGVKADLKLYESIDATGAITYKDVVTDTTNNKQSQVLTSLDQNVKTKVTAIVYLEGENVDNSMVSALGNVTGTMNLQFSSSADLQPMENTDIRKGK